MGPNTIDVTEWLRARATTLPFRIQATNENIGSDPAYGKTKYLVVRYQYNGEEKTKTVAERQYLELP